ncbi:substrate-binding domain-containing protein [Streptomyces ardesiacus]|uniref:substrate-binding domain-containing protein n=1 Tax=Streptomyces ardesiacus TaxID=285564 RepID=UPI003801D499
MSASARDQGQRLDTSRCQAGPLAEGPSMTAAFAANDQMAFGIIGAPAEDGHIVPEDVRMIGFDDVLESAYLTGLRTTVRQAIRAPAACRQTWQTLHSTDRAHPPRHLHPRQHGQQPLKPAS